MPSKNVLARGRSVLLSGMAMMAAGCSSGGLNPFGGVSDIDRTFLLAAGNWDRNKDGVVTCDEWKAYATELFDGADAGRKGFVTPDEWKRIVAIDRMFDVADFKYYDRNGDGKVDRAEFVDRPNRAFELADRDKNCQMTAVELSGARAAGTPAPKIVPAGSESGNDKNNPGGTQGPSGRR